MTEPIRILLQTTIPYTEDDWNITRFSLLKNYLASLKNEAGELLCRITARDRLNDEAGNDPILISIDQSDFDELWLFAVDIGDGITNVEYEAIDRFRQRGGGLLVTRDHQDLGCSIRNISGVGAAHFFHSQNQESEMSRRCNDDIYATYTSYPNYHSGRNGDYQKITAIEHNWDVNMGCPSFVSEPAGETMQTEPRAIEDLKTYLHNLVLWLAPIGK
jgi:hypothetical protein